MTDISKSEQRREDQMRAMAVGMDGPWELSNAFNALLAYFDGVEPSVADAIRFGHCEVRGPVVVDGEQLSPSWYQVNYPEQQ